MSVPATILVIDDEVQIQRLLALTLEPTGYRLRTASTGRDGIAMAGTERPDVILLDLGLPDMDGREVLAQICQRTRKPVIILSVRSAESDIVGCLEEGADDYMVKPFRTGELLARVRNAIRRSTSPEGVEISTIRDITINFSSREVLKKDKAVRLTANEYSLLTLFVKNAGRVLTHRFLLEHVWGPAALEETQYTRVYVGQLRKKIEDDPSSPRLILTESGIGYRMIAE